MYCRYCHTRLEPDMRFCPECGQPVPQGDRSAADPGLYDEDRRDFDLIADRLREMDTPEPEPDAFDRLFLSDPADRNLYSTSAAYRDEALQPAPTNARQEVTPVAARRAPNPQPLEQEEQPVAAVPAAAVEPAPVPPVPRPASTDSDFGDGYTDETTAAESGYRRTSAGKRLGSIALCILTAATLLFTALSVSLRLTLTEDRIEEAANVGDLQNKSIITDQGVMPAADYLFLKIGGASVLSREDADPLIRGVLSHGTLQKLYQNILTDYAAYFLNDGTPEHLNATSVCDALEALNEELRIVFGDTVTAFDTEEYASRINGGDLSFLSIDEDGGYFQQRYGLSPKAPAVLLSPLVTIICGAIAVLCMVMIFVINSSNAPAGLNFNGVVTVLVGGLTLLIAAGCLILSFIRNLWIAGMLLRWASIWLAAFGGGALLVGVVFLIIAKTLKRRRKQLEI